jgi:hypothetical protein
MEHITLDKVALNIGQLQLTILNLQAYIEKLEEEIKTLNLCQPEIK